LMDGELSFCGGLVGFLAGEGGEAEGVD